MTALIELVGSGKSRWTRTDDCNFLACSYLWNFCVCKTFFIGIFNDSVFVGFYADSVTVCTAGACLFTESGTYTGCEFGEVVCNFKTVVSLFPVALVDEVIPFGNEVVKRTA